MLAHELGHAGGEAHQASGVMAGTLAEGVRSVARAASADPAYDGWLNAAPAGAAQRDAAPVIDWSERPTRPITATPSRTADTSSLRSLFVSQLGATPQRANPNASLRIQLGT